jgi:hypothetical protein
METFLERRRKKTCKSSCESLGPHNVQGKEVRALGPSHLKKTIVGSDMYKLRSTPRFKLQRTVKTVAHCKYSSCGALFQFRKAKDSLAFYDLQVWTCYYETFFCRITMIW